MVPFVQLAYFRRTTDESLTVLRSIYVSFWISLTLFGVILLSILPFAAEQSALLTAVGLLVIGAASYIVEPRIERRRRCGTDVVLIYDFRTRIFLRIAMSTSVALFAFCAAFVQNCSWVYFAGLLFAAPSLVRAAPSRRALAREQEQLDLVGCDRSLIAALRHPQPG